eukprot:376643-Prymnesium_polylepis.3
MTHEIALLQGAEPAMACLIFQAHDARHFVLANGVGHHVCGTPVLALPCLHQKVGRPRPLTEPDVRVERASVNADNSLHARVSDLGGGEFNLRPLTAQDAVPCFLQETANTLSSDPAEFPVAAKRDDKVQGFTVYPLPIERLT